MQRTRLKQTEARLKDVVFTNIGGLKTACVTRHELVSLMHQRVKDYVDSTSEYYQVPLTIYDANGQSISMINSAPELQDIFNQAGLVHADGQSVVSMSRRFANHAIPERSATTDTIHDYPKFTHGESSHFFLGANQKIVENAAQIMASRYANFKMAGTHHGYYSSDEEQAVIDTINNSEPDVLWVGLGKPKEQYFIHNNKHRLNVPVIISCGGCYRYITGDYARAPEWMQRAGLEWLHRAFSEPKKLFWRYLTTNPHAIYCVLKHHYKAKP